jgi:hypothetical protein
VYQEEQVFGTKWLSFGLVEAILLFQRKNKHGIAADIHCHF